MFLPKFPVLAYAPTPFLVISIVDVPPQTRILYSFMTVPSEDRVVSELSSSASRCLNDNTNRQAPHYYEPYFGYLSSYIMSYALHVELDNDIPHTILRVTS